VPTGSDLPASPETALTIDGPRADHVHMRSVIGLCSLVGMTLGGYVPVFWGASALSLVSLLFGALGGVAGVWVGARISA